MAKKQAYNYEFKMLLEGIAIPFKSAEIVCTPNGVEFNVNVPVCAELFDLKPKTMVQIFFREWYANNEKWKDNSTPAWRLMADGFLSAFVVGEDSTGGRSVALICRDFRMDIRKSPAALAYVDQEEMVGEVRTQYSIHGLMQQIVIPGLDENKPATPDTRIYSNDRLMDLGAMIARIAGTSYGNITENAANGGNLLDNWKLSTNEKTEAEMQAERRSAHPKNPQKKYANGGLFLDAFIRGLWMEAVGGTTANSFLNKRLRVDKRVLVPRNYAGFNFFQRNNFGLEVGTVVMGNARFSSLEAAMMNVAGLFSVRVYSCSTPSLISLQKNSPGLEYVLDEKVREFMVEKHAEEFGQPFMLNETMLLPPLEFTAPPNCNLFFPPMYDRVSWQYDMDSDITRGYFHLISSLNVPGGSDFGEINFQIPNGLFNMSAEKKNKKPPLTLEERYKGVSVYHGSVEYNLAAGDVVRNFGLTITNDKGKLVFADAASKAKKNEKEAQSSSPPVGGGEDVQSDAQSAINKAKEKAAAQLSKKKLESFENNVANAYKRHAAIKYLNTKFAGRVVTVDMAFNPFVMCGFPGAIISAKNEIGTNVTKTILGMVQQVSHTIYITGESAEAATTVIMNNARFYDEPTDLDMNGMPLYMKATNPKDADFSLSNYEFTNPNGVPYSVPNAQPAAQVMPQENEYFDLGEEVSNQKGYVYVKDFLTSSAEDVGRGRDENIYVDRSYEPNRIAKFYDKVFGHKTPHFMIGNYIKEDGKPGNFVYDTMHEALLNLEKNNQLMTDYEYCIQFVRRNICSANAFYHAILGLSSGEISKQSGIQYVNYPAGQYDDEEPIKYYGVPTEKISSIPKNIGLRAGGFSSIRESSPVTAIIKERRDAVEAYYRALKNNVTGVKDG